MYLRTLHKGNQTVTEFLQQTIAIVDQLSPINEVISPQEHQSFVGWVHNIKILQSLFQFNVSIKT